MLLSLKGLEGIVIISSTENKGSLLHCLKISKQLPSPRCMSKHKIRPGVISISYDPATLSSVATPILGYKKEVVRKIAAALAIFYYDYIESAIRLRVMQFKNSCVVIMSISYIVKANRAA